MLLDRIRSKRGNAILTVLYLIIILSVLTALMASPIARDANFFRIELERARASDRAFSLEEKRLAVEQCERRELEKY